MKASITECVLSCQYHSAEPITCPPQDRSSYELRSVRLAYNRTDSLLDHVPYTLRKLARNADSSR